MKLFALLAIAGTMGAQSLRFSAVSSSPAPSSQLLTQIFVDGNPIAAAQFTLRGTALKYVTAIAARPGVNGIAASKQVQCGPLAATITCVVYGLTADVINPAVNYWTDSAVDVVLTFGATLPPSTLFIGAVLGAGVDGSDTGLTIQPAFSAIKFYGGDSTLTAPTQLSVMVI
jgi:hypothetical protein